MEFDDDTSDNNTSTSNDGVAAVVVMDDSNMEEEQTDVFQVRLSNLSSETEKLLTSIIDEEQQKLHPRGKKTGEDDAEPPPRPYPPSITLVTTVLGEDGGAGPPRRSSSTLRFRRSLLSQTTADQIMEGLFEEVNQNNHNSHRRDPQNNSTRSPVASVPSMSATNTDPLPYQHRTSMDSIMIDEDCYNIINTVGGAGAEAETTNGDDNAYLDPSIFGSGGGTTAVQPPQEPVLSHPCRQCPRRTRIHSRTSIVLRWIVS